MSVLVSSLKGSRTGGLDMRITVWHVALVQTGGRDTKTWVPRGFNFAAFFWCYNVKGN